MHVCIREGLWVREFVAYVSEAMRCAALRGRVGARRFVSALGEWQPRPLTALGVRALRNLHKRDLDTRTVDVLKPLRITGEFQRVL
jgi:hypothetical protein